MAMRDTTDSPRHDGADAREPESGGGRFEAGTPEDVAALYTWANIQGARYRDFSGSRVRYREQVRARAAETLRETKGGSGAEPLAGAESTGVPDGWAADAVAALEQTERLRSGGSGVRRESVSREVPVVRLADVDDRVARDSRTFRAELETRLRRAAAQAEAKATAGADRAGGVGSERVPVEESARAAVKPVMNPAASRAMAPSRSAGRGEGRPFRESSGIAVAQTSGGQGAARSQKAASGRRPVWDSGSVSVAADSGRVARAETRSSGYVAAAESAGEAWANTRWERVEDGPALPPVSDVQRRSVAPLALDWDEELLNRAGSGAMQAWRGEPEAQPGDEYAGPAWLYEAEAELRRSGAVPVARQNGQAEAQTETQPAAERWSALRDVLGEGPGGMQAAKTDRAGERRPPLLLVFSLAGGVGKTSVVATLGRVLSASGEQVALGDTAAYSLLPFYFGARDVRRGATRMFAPPEESADKPIFVANYELGNYELARRIGDSGAQRQLVADVLRNGAECNRVLLDLPTGADWLVRRMVALGSTVVVPLLPDLNSVIGLEAVERYFERMLGTDGNAVLPFYLLNRYDAELPLHVDVREALRRRLGERLLRCAIQRSASMSEALAEGMTVVDYAPESGVARDYFDLADWVRTVSPPAMTGLRNLRSGGH